MEQIKIEITIPDHEYKKWHDYDEGVESQIETLKREIEGDLNARGINCFLIQAKLEKD